MFERPLPVTTRHEPGLSRKSEPSMPRSADRASLVPPGDMSVEVAANPPDLLGHVRLDSPLAPSPDRLPDCPTARIQASALWHVC